MKNATFVMIYYNAQQIIPLRFLVRAIRINKNVIHEKKTE